MSKIKIILPWFTLAVYLVVVLSFIAAKRNEIICTNIKVTITDNSSNFFIEEEDVLSLLSDKGEHLINSSIESINVNKLEELLSLHPSVKEANVFRNIHGNIEIQISQRTPILRVINNSNESYYLDDDGALMPLSDKYAAHVLVASGNISEKYAKWSKVSLKEYSPEIVENSGTLLLDLFTLADYIYHDKFWNAQIEQIYVVGNEFELIPRVGTQIIHFGNINEYKAKFKKLKALYEQGMPQTGWNKYKTINLKYKNQVICTKR